MPINKNNALFVHIPRTGGSSLNKVICNKNIKTIGHNIRNPNYQWLKDYVKRDKREEFIFTFVRNPWDRAVSSFFYLNNGGNNPFDDKDRIKYFKNCGSNFKSFVKESFLNEEIFNQVHFKPQHEWICNEKGDVLADFVGKFENFYEDFKKISNILGIDLLNKIPHINRSEHKFYQKYYDEETKKILHKAYQKDIQLFQYDF